MCKKVIIFTDGSCFGNPGPGGYGVIIQYKDYKEEISAGYKLTTNNRMELMAAIVALETLKNSYFVILNTDSQYLRKGITQWIKLWEKRNWKNSSGNIIKNVDLWKRLNSVASRHILCCNWIKGHLSYKENVKCDSMAKTAGMNPKLEDTEYQKKLNYISK